MTSTREIYFPLHHMEDDEELRRAYYDSLYAQREPESIEDPEAFEEVE